METMNKLNAEKQQAIVTALIEGASIRSVERMTGIHRDTIMRLGVRAGETAAMVLDEMMRGLYLGRIEVDEIWCYVGKKQRHVSETDDLSGVGDFWTYVSMDAETRLVPAFKVGKRDAATTQAFIDDLASRLENRVQINSDGLRLYVEAIENRFGADVDYAQIVKSYKAEPVGPGRYSHHRWSRRARRASWAAGHEFCLNILRGAPEPQYAALHAPVHPPDQCFQQPQG